MSKEVGNLLKPAEAAACLQVSISFLAKARMNGTGPAFIRLGRAIRYSQDALNAYKASRTRTSTSERILESRARQHAPKQHPKYQTCFSDEISIGGHPSTSRYMK